MAVELTQKQIKWLKGQAHSLGPLLAIGKEGLSEGFKAKLDEGLTRQELVKLKLGRFVQVDLTGLAGELNAALVQQVGRVAVLYRPAPQPRLKLPRD